MLDLPVVWFIERGSAEAQQPRAFSALRLRGLVASLAAPVFRAALEPRPAGAALSGEQRQRLQRSVAAHLRDRLTPASLARALGLSGNGSDGL